MPDERSPLLQFPGLPGSIESLGDHHTQFCHLVGIKPLTHPPGQEWKAHQTSLWYRATRHRRNQGATYMFTATLTNGLLLSQVVLGAALTALGASDSSRVLITLFGAMNTVIAGLIAFLRSRGQPVRARMFRDELDRIVNEIEDSAVMWHGVAKGVHGYDAIDTNEEVTVRSEVARLTRLYDRAVKNSTMNDPDNYAAGMTGDPYSAALRARPGQPGASAPVAPPAQAPATGVPALPADVIAPLIPVPVADPDDSPATKAPDPKPKEPEAPKQSDKPKDDKEPATSDAEAVGTSEAGTSENGESGKPVDSKISLPESSSDPKEGGPSGASESSKTASATPGPADDHPHLAQAQKHSEDTSQ